MNLIRLAIERPIAVLAAVLMAVMFGLVALVTIPIQLTPDFRATTKPLAIAQSVTLELPIGESRRVVTVDKDGVIQQPDGAMVYLVEEEAAAPRPVQLGEAVGGRFEVLDGLKPGDLVVVRGNERLQPGQPITYPGAPEPANGPKTES